MSKFTIAKDRIPRPFNQNIVDANGKLLSDVGSCVACTFTKILEVCNYVKKNTYIELSKGYMYGRNNYEGKRNPGMNEEYTLNMLLKRGSVPVMLCPDYDEIPDIVKTLESRSDIAELDKLAEHYAIKGWENISKNNPKDRFETVKEYLHKYNMPLAGTLKKYKGISYHSVVIVGYDGDYILFHNHTDKDDIEKISYDKLARAYYIDCGIEEGEQMQFIDVEKSRWSYNDIKYVYDKDIMRGVSENKFEPTKPLTREEAAALIHRIMIALNK